MLPEQRCDHRKNAVHREAHRQAQAFPRQGAPGQVGQQQKPGNQRQFDCASQDCRGQGREQQHQPGQGEARPKQHHQHDGAINQGGAQVWLDENQGPGHNNHPQGAQQVAGALHRVAGQDPGQQQDRRQFGEFRRLHMEAANRDPALGPQGAGAHNFHRQQAAQGEQINGHQQLLEFFQVDPGQASPNGEANGAGDPMVFPVRQG